MRVLIFCLVALANAADIPLWPDKGTGKDIGVEKDTTTAKDALIAGRSVIRLGHVTRPTIAVYRPEKNNTGAAVVVFPGGGYNILAMDLEGTEVCEWLQSIGVTGVLLKYRVPAGRAAPLEDAQRAVGMVRYHAAEWGIDPKRIGVLGFSAGGHLAAALSNTYEKRTYEPLDEADKVSCRPDFALLIYPAYLTEANLKVTSETPPTFLAQTEDDSAHVENSLVYYAALKQAKVPVEMHLYPSGGHGYGLRPTEKTVTTWPKRAEEWLRAQGLLTKGS